MSQYIHFNGELLSSDTAIIKADSRGLRYGDGLFETMRIKDGRILLWNLHVERLWAGLRLLQFASSAPFTTDHLAAWILALCQKNGHTGSARVRLAVFRGVGALGDPAGAGLEYLIQSWAWEPPDGANGPGGAGLNTRGLVTGVFPEGRKACDPFANCKSNNYLLYAMGAMHAGRMGWDDCLVLNAHERVADSTIANVFYIKAGTIFTPPLSEGCVAGVMRRFLLDRLPLAGFRVEERVTSPEDLRGADAIFLSNALRGIRWVASFEDAVFSRDAVLAVQDVIFQDY